jgi:hypothetical protein
MVCSQNTMCGVCIEENVEVGLHVVVFTNIAKPHDVLEEKELQTCASSTLEACDFLTQSGEHAAKLSRLHSIASSPIFLPSSPSASCICVYIPSHSA